MSWIKERPRRRRSRRRRCHGRRRLWKWRRGLDRGVQRSLYCNARIVTPNVAQQSEEPFPSHRIIGTAAAVQPASHHLQEAVLVVLQGLLPLLELVAAWVVQVGGDCLPLLADLLDEVIPPLSTTGVLPLEKNDGVR